MVIEIPVTCQIDLGKEIKIILYKWHQSNYIAMRSSVIPFMKCSARRKRSSQTNYNYKILLQHVIISVLTKNIFANDVILFYDSAPWVITIHSTLTKAWRIEKENSEFWLCAAMFMNISDPTVSLDPLPKYQNSAWCYCL